MTRRESIELTRRVLDLMTEDTLDVAKDVSHESRAAFCDERRLAADKAMLRRTPHVVGWAGEVAPGEFTTKDVAGCSVLFTRTRDGELKAFVNACAHRGAELTQGCGKSRMFVCPYHGWAYGLDGQLVGTPSKNMFDVEDRRGLIELPVTEQCGLIVVGLSPDVRVEGHLDDISDPLSDYNFGQRRHFATRRLDVAANWKLTIKVNFEGYHFKYVHTDSLYPMVTNNSTADVFGRHVRWAFPFRDIVQFRDQPVEHWPDQFFGTIAYLLFPTCVLVEAPGSLQMLRMYPGDKPGRTVMYMSIATLGDVPEAEHVFHTQIMDATYGLLAGEDLPMAEACQRGLDSGMDRIAMGRNEMLLQHMASVWQDALLETAAPDSDDVDLAVSRRA